MTEASLCAGISTVHIGNSLSGYWLCWSPPRSHWRRKNIDVVIHMMLVTIG